jgi:hypothetical protein
LRDEIASLQRLLKAAEARARLATQAEAIPPEMLKVLLLLCHPDRHSSSQASNRAMTWLLQQRGKAA